MDVGEIYSGWWRKSSVVGQAVNKSRVLIKPVDILEVWNMKKREKYRRICIEMRTGKSEDWLPTPFFLCA